MEEPGRQAATVVTAATGGWAEMEESSMTTLQTGTPAITPIQRMAVLAVVVAMVEMAASAE